MNKPRHNRILVKTLEIGGIKRRIKWKLEDLKDMAMTALYTQL